MLGIRKSEMKVVIQSVMEGSVTDQLAGSQVCLVSKGTLIQEYNQPAEKKVAVVVNLDQAIWVVVSD